jgi:DDE family transposase
MATSRIGSIKTYFRKVLDPRVRGRSRHLLVDILVIAICGVIADCDSWQEIVLFGQKREPWLKRFLKLPHGIPAHDTLVLPG